MARTVVVSGTGTEVGKTWVAARLAQRLRGAGIDVVARKPVQSFIEGHGPIDAEVLAAATGEEPGEVCRPRYSYALPLAPPMAADALGAPPIFLANLVEDLALPGNGICLVEGVGGPRSPLANDGDTVALAAAIDADVVLLIAHPGLGVINDVLLGIDAFAGRDVVVFFNRYDATHDLHRRNHSWLTDVAGLKIVVDIDELADMFATTEVR